MGEIEQEGLIGKARPAVEPDPGQAVIDDQPHDHDRPFDVAELAPHKLRVNRLARLMEAALPLRTHGPRINPGCARHRFFPVSCLKDSISFITRSKAKALVEKAVRISRLCRPQVTSEHPAATIGSSDLFSGFGMGDRP